MIINGGFWGRGWGGYGLLGADITEFIFLYLYPPPQKKIIEVAFEFEVIQFCISIEENVTWFNQYFKKFLFFVSIFKSQVFWIRYIHIQRPVFKTKQRHQKCSVIFYHQSLCNLSSISYNILWNKEKRRRFNHELLHWRVS